MTSPAGTPVARKTAVSEYRGPRDFRWMTPGLLGGARRPGIFDPIERDLEALARVGTRLLVTLTEEWTPDPALIARFRMESVHLPVPDREPPDAVAARALADRAAAVIDAGEAVVYHCHAGRGRTGVMVVCQLIRAGLAPEEAVRVARRRNPTWIESDSQMEMVLACGPVLMEGPPTGTLLLSHI